MDSNTTALNERVLIEKKWLDLLYDHFCHCQDVEEELRRSVPYPKDSAAKENQLEKGRHKSLNWIFKRLPEAGGWKRWQLRFLDGQNHYRDVVKSFTAGIESRTKACNRLTSSRNLIVIGEELARLTQSSIKSKDLQEAVSSFQLLLILSYCLFLKRNDTADGDIDRILQQVTSVRESDRRTLLKRASQVNHLINRLITNGWDIYRATELFFLLAMPTSHLIKLQNNDFDTLFEVLTDGEQLEHEFDECMNVPFNIPGLLKAHLDQVYPQNGILYQKFLFDIGYDVTHIPSDALPLPTEVPLRKRRRLNGRGNGSFPLNTSDTTHWPEEEHRTDQRRMYQNEAQAQVDIGNDYSPLLRTMQSTTFETQNEEEMMIGDLGFSERFSEYTSDDQRMISPLGTPCETRAAVSIYSACSTPIPEPYTRPLLFPSMQHGFGTSDVNLVHNNPGSGGPILFETSLFDQQRSLRQREEISRPIFSIPNGVHTPLTQLLYSVNVYFEYLCENLHFDQRGVPLALNGTTLRYDHCSDLDSYCFNAIIFARKKDSSQEFHSAISRASDLVRPVLRTEHPRSLSCFLEVFIYFIQTGHIDVTNLLRKHIKALSSLDIKNGHPLRKICETLGELDSQVLLPVLTKVWRFSVEVFTRKLGNSHPLTVAAHLDCLKRIYGHTGEDFLNEEQELRKILTELEYKLTPSTPRVMLNLAHNLNKQKRYEEAREMALKVCSLLNEHDIYADRIVEKIEYFKIISHSYFHQSEASPGESYMIEAEKHMLISIQMIEQHYGKQHSWVIEFKNVLESWLRMWGREQDADNLQNEISILMTDDQTSGNP